MNNEVISLGRDFLEFEWFSTPEAVSLYLYLLLRASRKENVIFGVNVKRGQFLAMRQTLMKALGIKSTQKFKTAKEYLEKGGYIKIDKVRRYYLITLLRYEDYASPSNS